MYQILNFLFGWDYIQWRNTADQGVARVRVDGAGVVWYWRYTGVSVADRITHPAAVIWLTCSPDKYFNPHLESHGPRTTLTGRGLKAEAPRSPSATSGEKE